MTPEALITIVAIGIMLIVVFVVSSFVTLKMVTSKRFTKSYIKAVMKVCFKEGMKLEKEVKAKQLETKE